MIVEIKEKHLDVLHDLIAIYGETIIIHFLSESIIYKASRLEEHLKRLKKTNTNEIRN